MNSRVLPWVLLLLAALVAHGLSVRADFYMDDFLHILLRDSIISDGVDAELSWKGRLLTFAIWRALYLNFGASAMAFHAVNLLLHLLVTLLAYGVFQGFTSMRATPKEVRERAPSLAFWGALIFAVHPLCSEPINYASQTTILLASLFAMLVPLGILTWQRTHSSLPLLGAGVCVLLAGLAKEPGFWHAAINGFFVLMLGMRQEWRWKKLRAIPRRTRWFGIGVLGFGGVVFVASWLGTVLKLTRHPEQTLHHMLTQARVLGEYVRRMVIPAQQSSDHHFQWTLALTDTEAVLKLVIIVLAALVILYAAVIKRRWLAALLALCSFHLLIRFGYQVDEPMVEYRTYPSMPWVGLALVYGLRQVTDFRWPRLQWVPRLVLPVLVICFATLSINRAQLWHNEQRLVMNVLHQYPLNLRALGIYFKNLMLQGHYEPVLMGADLPDSISEQIKTLNRNSDRHYSEHRMHHDYASCQYYIIRAHLLADDPETALRKTNKLLVDLLLKRRYGSADAFFTMYLSRVVCHHLMGDEAAVQRTYQLAEAVLPNAQELPEMLKAELKILSMFRPELADASP